MNNLKKLLIGAALLGGASAASAEVVCNSTGNSCIGPATEMIQGLFPSPQGGILIESAPTVDGTICAGVNGNNVIFLPSTHLNYKETYAALLTASVSGNDVQLRMDDDEATCTLFFARFIN